MGCPDAVIYIIISLLLTTIITLAVIYIRTRLNLAKIANKIGLEYKNSLIGPSQIFGEFDKSEVEVQIFNKFRSNILKVVIKAKFDFQARLFSENMILLDESPDTTAFKEKYGEDTVFTGISELDNRYKVYSRQVSLFKEYINTQNRQGIIYFLFFNNKCDIKWENNSIELYVKRKSKNIYNYLSESLISEILNPLSKLYNVN